MMPPPVHKMKMTVKQRPGMNYPRPVNHVNISEVNRAPFRLFGGTVPCLPRPGCHKSRRRVLRGGVSGVSSEESRSEGRGAS